MIVVRKLCAPDNPTVHVDTGFLVPQNVRLSKKSHAHALGSGLKSFLCELDASTFHKIISTKGPTISEYVRRLFWENQYRSIGA